MTRVKKAPSAPALPPEADRRVTTGYIGALVGLQRPAVRDWLDSERVPVTWINGRRLYRLGDVEAAIARNTIKPLGGAK